METLDFDLSESDIESGVGASSPVPQDQVDEHQESAATDAQDWHLDELARHRAVILSGDFSVREAGEEYPWRRSEIESWLADHTTQAEREKARRVRRQRLATWRAAADIYLAAERARQQAASAS